MQYYDTTRSVMFVEYEKDIQKGWLKHTSKNNSPYLEGCVVFFFNFFAQKMNKMTIDKYIEQLTHPLYYFRVNKEVVKSKRKYFTYMFNCKISAEMAIILMGSKIEDLIMGTDE